MAGDNEVAEAGRKPFNLSFYCGAQIGPTATRNVAIRPSGVFVGRRASLIENALLG